MRESGPFDDLSKVDWHRLLQRASNTSDAALASQWVSGKRLLITGAGGSIGSALARAIASCAPDQLILLDASEQALYEVDRAASGTWHRNNHLSVLGRIDDQALMDSVFEQHRPQIIFHAAAFKHVPLGETNPFAVVENNVLGTHLLAKSCQTHGAESMVLVSTDKAADPASLMGASKRIAELILLSRQQINGTRMRAVRLGNVLGSQGSVVPLFLEQIAQGGPVTVTSPHAQRYFITPQAAVLALLAALSPEWTECVLVPELGQEVRVVDLAKNIIAACSPPGETPRIVYTGLRAGDKMKEVPIASSEQWVDDGSTSVNEKGLRQIRSTVPEFTAFEAEIVELDQSLKRRDLARMIACVQRLVPEYRPSSVLADAVNRASPVFEGTMA